MRQATQIVEDELEKVKAFQFMDILHQDKVTGMRRGKRDYGFQIEVRCRDTKDAVRAVPVRLSYPILEKLACRLPGEVPGVVSVTYNITPKPPSTMQAV